MFLNKLQDVYYRWINNQYKINKIKDLRGNTLPFIKTPFCNFLGDNFVIYVIHSKHNKIILDDDGETINNFSSLDINLFTKQRKQILNNILLKYDINLVYGDMLSVSGKISEFPKMESNLILAMIKIDAMHILVRRNVARMFKDDMYELFNQLGIKGKPKASFKGVKGGKYTFDYVSKSSNHSNLIDFSNSELNFDKITSYAYKFKDVMNNYDKKFKNFIIFNAERRSPSSRIENIARGSKIKMISSANRRLVKSSISKN